jgi:8-amino-7-oxononanoate synthase
MELHRRLEDRISRFLGFERSLFFSSGYAANVGVIQSLFDSSDVIFSDSLNHASLIDGCRLSRARVFIYNHLDSSHLSSLLSQNRSLGRKALVVTESVFSMDGDFSPLRDLRSLCDSFDAALMVDEAHSLGVFGNRGTGLSLSLGVVPDIFIGTFGKAFGAFGAFVSSSNDVVQLLENRARSFVFSTAPPVILASAAIASIDLVESANDLRSRLFLLSSHLRRSLSDIGFHLVEGSSPIIPVLFGDPKRVVDFSSSLFDLGFFVQGIRPPSVPFNSSRLRLIPIATHTHDDIASLTEAFRSLLSLYNAR